MLTTKHGGLPDGTRIGLVHLKISDLEQSLAFYRDLLGLHEVAREGPTAWLAARPEGPVLLALTQWPNARPRPRGTTGLHHVAFRLPTRQALARVFKHLVDHHWPFYGFSDHKVSEAIYLPDPDENGIELYWDRPRELWPWQNGHVVMRTTPLDPRTLLQETEDDRSLWKGIHPDTCIGHVHLSVADLQEAETVYYTVLGLRVMQRDYPGARFFAAGHYHHHVGTNIWAGHGASPPPPEAVGLSFFTLVVPDESALFTVARLASWGGCLLRQNSSEEVWIEDKAGNVVRVTLSETPDPAFSPTVTALSGPFSLA